LKSHKRVSDGIKVFAAGKGTQNYTSTDSGATWTAHDWSNVGFPLQITNRFLSNKVPTTQNRQSSNPTVAAVRHQLSNGDCHQMDILWVRADECELKVYQLQQMTTTKETGSIYQ
jgi:hypothetical protein